MSGDLHVMDNRVWAGGQARLSVLIPFLARDPCPLLSHLAAQPQRVRSSIEVVLLDDGTGDDPLATRVTDHILALRLPARFLRLLHNQGRARARNRLAAHARGRHLLFLDCDMRPGGPDFLKTYLSLAAADDPPVTFGGFSVPTVVRPEHALHYALAQQYDRRDATARRAGPGKWVFGSNLMVRRDVFAAEAFDEAFQGWGWEDVEWGLRVARRFRVVHIDNPAIHLGLEPAEVLAGKYEQSVGNFARLVARHGDMVRSYPTYRLARQIKHVPGRRVLRRAFKATALARFAPLRARVAALLAFRAALYAEIV